MLGVHDADLLVVGTLTATIPILVRSESQTGHLTLDEMPNDVANDNGIPTPNPKLFAHPILGARFTPIHFLLTVLLIQFPLLMFLAYRGTLKRWSFEQYIVAKRTDFMVSPPSKPAPQLNLTIHSPFLRPSPLCGVMTIISTLKWP